MRKKEVQDVFKTCEDVFRDSHLRTVSCSPIELGEKSVLVMETQVQTSILMLDTLEAFVKFLCVSEQRPTAATHGKNNTHFTEV